MLTFVSQVVKLGGKLVLRMAKPFCNFGV